MRRSNHTLKMRTRATIGCVAAMGISLLFAGAASAHNVSIPGAKAKFKPYVQKVIDAPGSRYVSANIGCSAAFRGHNHVARCTAKYETNATKNTKSYACVETLDVYYLPLKSDGTRTLFMRHITRACGSTVLTGPQPS